MIYVFWGYEKDDDGNPVKSIKIGFSNNFDKRLEVHKSSHPTLTVLFTIEDGTEEDEFRIHEYFRKLRLPYTNSREWFFYCDKIVEFFKNHATIEDIRNSIPEARKGPVRYLGAGDISQACWCLANILNLNYAEFRKLVNSVNNLSVETAEDLFEYFEQFYNKEDIDKAKRNLDSIKNKKDNLSLEGKKFLEDLKDIHEATTILKMFCELDNSLREEVVDYMPIYHQRFYKYLGPERCKALGYNYTKLERECKVKSFDITLVEKFIYSNFHEGDRVSLREAKEILRKGYEDMGYEKSPKASDLSEWFELKEAKIPNSSDNSKRDKAFQLLKKNPRYLDGFELLKKKQNSSGEA